MAGGVPVRRRKKDCPLAVMAFHRCEGKGRSAADEGGRGGILVQESKGNSQAVGCYHGTALHGDREEE
jgi:hypothetical protein